MEKLTASEPIKAVTGLNTILSEDIESVAQELLSVLRPLSGTTLLITGGSGFLCSYFLDVVAWLNDHGWSKACRVVCLDNFRSGLADRIAHLAGRSDFQFVERDVSKPWEHREPAEWIVHGASVASPTFYRRYPLETIDVNVNGTWQMLELARLPVTRSMLYISTSEIYGDPDPASIPTAESYLGHVSCRGPRACYDESKRLAETLCWVYHSLHKVPVKIVRPFNVYGPGQRLDDGRIIPDLMSAAVDGRPIVLYSDGRATRAFCYITDAIRAMFRVLLSDAQGEVFNVGNDQEELSIREVAQRMREVAGPPWLEIRLAVSEDANYLIDNPERRCPDVDKLRNYFGWEPAVTLTEGLGRLLSSCRESKMGLQRSRIGAGG